MRLPPVPALRPVLAALALAAGPAQAYEQTVADPGYTVSVPALAEAEPEVELRAEPLPQVGSTRVCAGRFLRGLVQRPGMPDRDRIYRAPLDEATFLVLYLREDAGRSRLHAHLLGVLPGSHCLEAHFSRPLPADAEGATEAWRRSFVGASLRPTPQPGPR